MSTPPDDFQVAKRNAWRATLTMALAVLGFVVALNVAVDSPNRELWILRAIAFWLVAAIVGLLSAPGWVKQVRQRLIGRK